MSRIVVHGLEKSYGDARVLERVSVTAEPGEFLSLVGASGCGKSTFLRILLGQEQQSGGVVVIGDRPIVPEPTPQRGIVFQRYSVFPHLTALQNLLLVEDFRSGGPFGRVFGARRRRARQEAETMLERVGLAHARDLYPASLSGGMQQRLAIAQTLLGRPQILLLDEPFGALDPGIRVEMHELLTELWNEHGMTVVMVTHDIGEAFKLGTRVLVFDKVRHDPQFPSAYGATITYDLKLDHKSRASAREVAEVAAMVGTTRLDNAITTTAS
ncbi:MULTISPECIES: ATP-binding cassette domain-containing protein [unclassified Mesorhizobium]|uniref:ATP-binding cassette domain-containing protein n=1 Tax=unclassified Mesorhizobium TaxID=325217 RepID=UPI000F758CFA|nr:MULTISPECIES: ATP-binding cassette domain-containing protein [unclassified Mesorhizobium]AZO21514.1 ATP-binding cassette domain-containing protein [Mesorhizobium sp. M1E.F.Ca.ET.045.02.1.1]RUW27794.1 ATP-binding cassette domain-containing protein [Mesorhizobium sp. M1E.F.Ca.ET.041.01.1.1]RUW83122.1 ATP-binding cassette domain-containing protein [Mesorhizobium sp. M1E.F.Ca.ET.063.01.1.1]RWD91240.1 MAG: ATP-binding cassette domain-containing protein [Mesorhizobium sp.]RWD95377.1 MAG: ATP-bind